MATSKIPASFRVIGHSVVHWWDGWLDMVMITAVWFLAQFTVVLGPPATFGVYYVIHNMINGEAMGVRGLIAGARKYFGTALLWGLINLAVVLLFVVNYQFYGNVKATWGLYLQILIVMIGVLWFCTNFYGLAYFHEQEIHSLKIALRNGLLTTLAAPLFTLILLILIVVIIALSVGFIIPTFLALPALIPTMGFMAMVDRLEAFGLRKREKTPKEIELEEGGRIEVPTFDRSSRGSASPAGGEIADSEGQEEKEE